MSLGVSFTTQLIGLLSEGALSKVMLSKWLTCEKDLFPAIPSRGLEKSPRNHYNGGGLKAGKPETLQVNSLLQPQLLLLALPLDHAMGNSLIPYGGSQGPDARPMASETSSRIVTLNLSSRREPGSEILVFFLVRLVGATQGLLGCLESTQTSQNQASSLSSSLLLNLSC